MGTQAQTNPRKTCCKFIPIGLKLTRPVKREYSRNKIIRGVQGEGLVVNTIGTKGYHRRFVGTVVNIPRNHISHTINTNIHR